MTQEDKQLLLKDLCGRLPYGVMAENVLNHEIFDLSKYLHCLPAALENFKPYLRPMSSMTEKECIALSHLKPYNTDVWKYIKTSVPLYIANIRQFDFFLSHHLDWRGLIPIGLALEAPEDMYKIE